MEMIHGMSVLEYLNTAVLQDQVRTQQAIINVMLKIVKATYAVSYTHLTLPTNREV